MNLNEKLVVPPPLPDRKVKSPTPPPLPNRNNNAIKRPLPPIPKPAHFSNCDTVNRLCTPTPVESKRYIDLFNRLIIKSRKLCKYSQGQLLLDVRVVKSVWNASLLNYKFLDDL